ncbi:inositol polyphosphate 5-phosphatase [Entamoeba marina]
MKEYTQTIELKNHGKFIAEYEVLETDGEIYQHDWLTITNCSGIIDIFEQKRPPNFTTSYSSLHSKTVKIQLWEGKTLSFTVHVKTLPSIIGMSLDSLLYLNKPLIGESFNNNYTQTPFIIPKEIHRLTDYIIKNHEMGCFNVHEQLICENDRIKDILVSLNTETPFKPYAIELYCDVLLMIIGGLRHPIFHMNY